MMYEPTGEEARRSEALSQAIMSTSSTDTISGSTVYNAATKMLLSRADEIEQYLKEGKREVSDGTAS